MRGLYAFLAAIAMAIAAGGPPAHGAEASLAADDFIYEGFDGEDNAVVVTGSSGSGTVTVTDAPGVIISPGAGCSNPEVDNTATCTGALLSVDIETRGGSDTADLRGLGLSPTIEPVINTGAGSDTVFGSAVNDDILGGPGDDVLQGGPGADRTFGGAGVDVASYELETAPVTVDMTPGTDGDGPTGANDDVNPDGSTEGLIGGSGGDALLGTGEANRIDGAGGADVIDGAGGADELSGGAGSDGVDGGADADRISGDGGSGAGDPDQDFLLGGTEEDVVVYDERSFPVAVDLEDPGPDGTAGEGDDLAEFEGVIGGEGDDVLVGTADENTLAGGVGDDLIDGGPGLDELFGGAGADTADYARRTSAVSVLVGPHGGGGEPNEADRLEGFENVRGGAGPDNLRGDDSPNGLDGGPGDDTLSGAGDRDQLQGGDGADTLNGEDGDDVVAGGSGSDTADGGAGDDALRMRDGEADDVVCGSEFDAVIVDPFDTLDGCDSADTGVAPAPVVIERIIEVPTPVSVPAAPSAPVADDSRPSITLGRLPATMRRAAFLKGVRVAAGCDEACAIDVELRGSTRAVRLARTYDLRLGSKSLGRGTGTRRVTVKPARRLIGRARRLTAQLRITATDAAGNRSTRTRTIKVR